MTVIMERPYKRQCLSGPPEMELHHRRERNDRRLKSTFESIFEKYSKNFVGIGDEINLETGEIVVNNGHILSMTNERDVGDYETDWEEYGSGEWSDDEGILASSLLSETRQRIGTLKSGGLQRRMDYTDEDTESDDGTDSLLGDNDSLMGDAKPEPSLPVMQMSTIAPDKLYDEETEDELASSELEWPTPRKAWPTPKKATPLSHTPWHSSPLNPVYSGKSPIDPAWKAPPLPEDGELQKFDSPADPPCRHDAEDIDLDHSVQKHPIRVSGLHTPYRRPASITSPLDHMKSLDRRKWGRAAGTTARSRSVESMKWVRWTNAEENLLRRLRTTTRLMYSEIKPFFPGRRTNAIMLHWSMMMRKVGIQKPSYDIPRSGGALFPLGRDLSPKLESNKLPVETDRRASKSDAAEPAPRNTPNGSKDPTASAVPYLVLQSAACSPGIQQQTASPPRNQEIPNSSDPMEELQGTRSSSLVACTSPWGPPSQPHRKTPPLEDIKKEWQGEQATINTVTAPDVQSASAAVTRVPQNANKGLHSSPRSATSGRSRSESAKTVSSDQVRTSRSTSSTSLSTGQTSESRQEQPLASKKALFLPSYPSDVSDDELSVPVKTVGLYQSQKRRTSTPMLSDIVLR